MEKNCIGKGKKILILDGFCKQILPFIRGFKNLGCSVTVLCNSKLDCGYASRLPDKKILIECDWKNADVTEDNIIRVIKSSNYDIVYPLFDLTVQFMSHHKEELSSYSIICANDREVFDAAFNKNEVMRVCMNNNLPCPKTYLNIKCVDDIKQADIQYPIIIKPHSMYGARGFHIFKNEKDLERYVKEKDIDLSHYVVQEQIPEGSKVMGCNIFIDRNGKIKSNYLYVCEHLYPENGGTSTLNAILDRDDIRRNCAKLVKIMNLRGIIGIDLMIDNRDNIAKVIEINVRPVHGIAVGFFFGVNHALQVLEDVLGKDVTSMKITKMDTCVRITQTDVLWFIKSPSRFRRSPKKLGYKHVIDQMFFIDDPLPWFAFLISGLKDYKKKMKEKTQ